MRVHAGHAVVLATLVKVDAASYDGHLVRVVSEGFHAVGSGKDMVVADNCTTANVAVIHSEGYGVGKLAGIRIRSVH